MKDKYKLMTKIQDNVESVKRFIKDYVCLLDDPAQRRIALTIDYEEAKRVFQNKIAFHTDYDRAQKIVAFAYVSLIGAIPSKVDATPELIGDNWMINDALLDLGFNISTREDRIVACRQIDVYPFELGKGDYIDPTLDNNAHHVAGVVQNALTVIGEAMAKLQTGKELA